MPALDVLACEIFADAIAIARTIYCGNQEDSMPIGALVKLGSKGPAVTQAQNALNYHLARKDASTSFSAETVYCRPTASSGPITRGRLFAIGVARIRFTFKKLKNTESFRLQPSRIAGIAFQKVQRPRTFGLQPGLVGDGPAPQPSGSRLLVVDWGQAFAFQPFAKLDDDEHLLKTELKLGYLTI